MPSGIHLVAGGEELAGRDAVLMFRIAGATLVYCPEWLRDRAADVVAETRLEAPFGASLCARIAGVAESEVHGPAWHGFVDHARFATARGDVGAGDGHRVDRHDSLLDELSACAVTMTGVKVASSMTRRRSMTFAMRLRKAAGSSLRAT